MPIQQLLGKNDIIWLHYGRSQKHPKSDIPDALQKATNVQLFPRQVTFWRVGPRMQISCQIAVFMLVALVAATPNCPVSTVGLEALYTTTVLSTITITGTPEAKNTITSANYMTVAVTNQLGNDVSLSFGSNAGGPSPVGNPSPTALHDNGFTQYAFPTGWAGRIYVGPNLNPDGSKIEGSYTGPPDIDVSYVDGYSVPITCSSEGTAVSGCNIDLFKQPGISCNDQVDGPVCLNSAQNIANGPAPPFFAACAGAAYTYPNDNDANVSNLKSALVSCCIGTSCNAPPRQPEQGNTLHDERMRIRNTKSHLPGRSVSSSFRHRHRHYSPRYVIDG